MHEIKYIKNKDIDIELWDKCITRAYNGSVFAYSWYLNSVCNNWDAIIIDNYKAVLPLTPKKIFGISGISQPKYLVELNLYLTKEISPEVKTKIFSYLPAKYKFLNIKTYNKSILIKKCKILEKKSYRLDLISSYSKIKKSYSEFYKKELKISIKNKIFYNTGILPNGLVLLSSVSKKLSKNDQNKLRLLSAVSLRKNKGDIYGAFNDKNKLIVAVLFIRSHFKINIIVAFQTKEAQKKRALHGLIDYYIKTNSEKAQTLEFNGLNFMPYEFYEGLGAKEYPFYLISKRFLF